MKHQRISGSPEKLAELLEEYLMIGYFAEMDGDELVVYYGNQPRKQKKTKRDGNDKWTKRERNFGYTRG